MTKKRKLSLFREDYRKVLPEKRVFKFDTSKTIDEIDIQVSIEQIIKNLRYIQNKLKG